MLRVTHGAPLPCKLPIECPAIYEIPGSRTELSVGTATRQGGGWLPPLKLDPRAGIQPCGGRGSSVDLPGLTRLCLSYQSGMSLGWHSPGGQGTTGHLMPNPGASAHAGGWSSLCLQTVQPQQCSDSSKFTPVRQNHLFLLFLLCFPLAPFHTPFFAVRCFQSSKP